ncbi:MAG: VCBS repeat-containing protein [Bacteroidetes bacterium]|nr:MAG: VCBS repeat-containing protein [Bacteroidota bacterium]RLD71983.1 MAG: VCBS repeat-containing protein [Bacteroidota bacterium]RLD94345.1 MAG: VCBS repeat-containing protein [Bacteroidota bacterium]RLD94419.1 MAG: VCBS repeat-containing protein [Bacteroidota bacterium]
MIKSDGSESEKLSTSTVLDGEKKDFLIRQHIGLDYDTKPMISHVLVDDLDNDGLLDVIVCDALDNFVSWIRQYPENTYTETVLATELIAPAHVQVKDFDGDGDKDLLVAVLGLLYPSNDKIGSIVYLENDGNFNFKKTVIVDRIARVADVRAGDLDGDGDMDLAAAQFGYDDGETRWMENLGNGEFKTHMLQNLSGPINVEIVDIDADSDLDLIVLVSQEWEEIYCYINDGSGNFRMKLLWGSDNEDFGSSGISLYDLNQDGKLDILYANGDAFDYIPPEGKPWHGLQWFENKGNLEFEYHRLCDLVGAYSLRAGDADKDGDLDLFAVSAFNLWEDPAAQSFIWLENVGDMEYIRRDITNDPTHLMIMQTGDFNKDGLIDFVTGGMYPYPPFDRMSRVTLWTNDGSLISEN